MLPARQNYYKYKSIVLMNTLLHIVLYLLKIIKSLIKNNDAIILFRFTVCLQ